MKRCTVCDLDKPLKEFYLFKGKPTKRCIACIKERRKELRDQHRDEYKYRRNSSTGARGVVVVKRKSGTKYRAQVKHNGRYVHLGIHEDVLDAICAASDYRIQHDLN